MSVNSYSSLYQAYLVVSDGSVITVYNIPGGSDISVDTGRGGPDPSTAYQGTDASYALASETNLKIT